MTTPAEIWELRRPLVTPERIASFFTPRRVAIIGAAATSKWARNVIRNLSVMPGVIGIHPIHRRHEQVLGHRCSASLVALGQQGVAIDLAIILVGSDSVDAALQDAADAGVHNAVLLASGFRETGEQGQQRQLELTKRAIELGITLLGPNSMGFINAGQGHTAWVGEGQRTPLPGPVGGIFESGSMGRAAFEFAHDHGVGTSLWISVGTGAVISAGDALEHLIRDPGTRSVALFLEGIGEPERFLDLARRARDAGTALVAMKVGRSDIGKQAATDHTGAIATDDAVVDAALHQAGVVRVDSLEELIATSGLLGSARRLPAGRRMGVVTSSGGGNNIIADLAATVGLELPPWQPSTVSDFRELLPPFAYERNPLDTTGFANAAVRHRPTKAEDDLLEIAGRDGGVDFTFSMLNSFPEERPSDPGMIEDRLPLVADIIRDSPVPVFLSTNTCRSLTDYQRDLLRQHGLFLLPGVDLGLRAINHALRWNEDRGRPHGREANATPPRSDEREQAAEGAWSEDEGRALLSRMGVEVVPAVLATTAEEAAAAAEQFAVPTVVKVVARDLMHKSDHGGVVLNVPNAAAAADAFDRVTQNLAASLPGLKPRGALVACMRPEGVEVFVGVKRDPSFGLVLAVGLGGLWIEVLDDTVLRLLPVDELDVESMLRDLRAYSVLTGGRGTSPVSTPALSRAIVAICRAAASLGDQLESLEVNPLWVQGERIEALDVVVVTRVQRQENR